MTSEYFCDTGPRTEMYRAWGLLLTCVRILLWTDGIGFRVQGFTLGFEFMASERIKALARFDYRLRFGSQSLHELNTLLRGFYTPSSSFSLQDCRM